LCEYNAEWIVEDYESGSSRVRFADFGTVTFTGASATTDGEEVGSTGRTLIDMESSSGTVLTDWTVSGSEFLALMCKSRCDEIFGLSEEFSFRGGRVKD
jgi:hypothetical protein